MKRIIVFIMVLVLALSVVSAVKVASFGIGNYLRNESVMDPEFSYEALLIPDNYRLGTEVRLGFFFTEVSLTGAFGDTNSWIDGMLTAGLNVRLFNFIHLGVGLGPYYGLSIGPDAIELRGYEGSGWSADPYTFTDVFLNSTIGYRAHIDFRLCKWTGGFSVEVPSDGFTFGAGNTDAMLPNFENMRFGASLLYWLF